MFRARVYGSSYLVMIPLFAWIYGQFPGEFYHANILKEPHFKQDFKQYNGQVKRLVDSLINLESLANFEKNRSINGIRKGIGDVDISSSKINLNILFVSTEKNEERFQYISGEIFFQLQKSDDDIFFIVDWTPLSQDNLASIGKNIELKFDDIFTSRIIESNISTYNNFINLKLALSGQPKGTSGHFLRMLYLSSITITTLGYGDIVPLTERTRSLVAIESILGVILIGLFLTALSRGQRPPQKTITPLEGSKCTIASGDLSSHEELRLAPVAQTHTRRFAAAHPSPSGPLKWQGRKPRGHVLFGRTGFERHDPWIGPE